MSNFQTIFKNNKVLLPVIHVKTEGQMLRNAKITYDLGCDGVFLINHGISYKEMLAYYYSLLKQYPDWWIGVNCLDLYPASVFESIPRTVSGVWVDNAMIEENSEEQKYAEIIQRSKEHSGWQGLYFGGVAFKYQRAVEELSKAARIAAQYMDVVTTSGPATGEAAERKKIIEMKEAIGDTPLAIASGVNPQNIETYLDYADCFLVATGISTDFWNLDEKLTENLLKKIR